MILYNMFKLAAYGALVLCYIWALNWSLNTFIYVRSKRNTNRMYKHRPKTKYSWQEIVSIPVYFITWGIVIFGVFVIIGAFISFIIEMINISISFSELAVTLSGPLIL